MLKFFCISNRVDFLEFKKILTSVQEFDPCRSNPCENNATCTILPDLLHPPYSCDCKPGFSGDRCEVDVDDCVSVTCPYNELCLDLVNAYECLCNPGNLFVNFRS